MTPLVPGQTIGGKYVLDEPLGLGELGPVWVAHHATLEVHLAVAFLSVDRAASAGARASFEEKAKAFAKVKSPHVAEVHDYGVHADVPFVAADLVEGEKLSTRMASEQRVSLGTAIPWVVQMGKALASIHEAGVMHGDVRPDNFVFAPDGSGEILELSILGMAKALPQASNKAALRAEIPLYDSPERVQNAETVDWRSDLWSFGVIIFELLTGRVPFPAEQAIEARIEIVADPVPAPSKTNPDLNEEVDRFFERALERDIERRFQSATEMVEAFVALSGAHLVGHGTVTLMVGANADRKTPVTPEVEKTDAGDAAIPVTVESAETTSEEPPHEDDSLVPMAEKDAAPQGPWTPFHSTKPDLRIGVIAVLSILLMGVLGVLIFVLTQPPPLSEGAGTNTTNDTPSFWEDEKGPIFVPNLPVETNAPAPAERAALGKAWPKASATASAMAVTAPSAAGSAGEAEAVPVAPPPKPTSIFGF